MKVVGPIFNCVHRGFAEAAAPSPQWGYSYFFLLDKFDERSVLPLGENNHGLEL